MIVSNDYDHDAANALGQELFMLANENEDLTHREILMAYMIAIGSTLSWISCKSCREKTAQVVKEMFPDNVGNALEFATKEYGDHHPNSGHTH